MFKWDYIGFFIKRKLNIKIILYLKNFFKLILYELFIKYEIKFLYLKVNLSEIIFFNYF